VKEFYLERRLRLKDMELYRIAEGNFGPTICYMFFMDFNRAGTLDDFPYLKGIEDEEEFSRSNFIKCLVLSSSEIEKDLKEQIINIANGFLENKEDCHWNLDFDIIDEEKMELPDIYEVLELLMKEKYSQSISICNIEEDKFNHLSQD
jgi:hypothetical protein